jgi:hypothetical protein
MHKGIIYKVFETRIKKKVTGFVFKKTINRNGINFFPTCKNGCESANERHILRN